MNFFPVRFDRLHDRFRSLRSPSSASPTQTPSGRAISATTILPVQQDERESQDEVSNLVIDQGRVHLKLSESQVFDRGEREAFGRLLRRLLEDPRVNLLRVDLSTIHWLEGESLAQFVRAHCRASQLGKQIILENVCEGLRELFHVTRFDRLVGIVDEARPPQASSLTRGELFAEVGESLSYR
jgi:anti-anti-sigma regulatory factor